LEKDNENLHRKMHHNYSTLMQSLGNGGATFKGQRELGLIGANDIELPSPRSFKKHMNSSKHSNMIYQPGSQLGVSKLMMSGNKTNASFFN
jgi:hypothetical protein